MILLVGQKFLDDVRPDVSRTSSNKNLSFS